MAQSTEPGLNEMAEQLEHQYVEQMRELFPRAIVACVERMIETLPEANTRQAGGALRMLTESWARIQNKPTVTIQQHVSSSTDSDMGARLEALRAKRAGSIDSTAVEQGEQVADEAEA